MTKFELAGYSADVSVEHVINVFPIIIKDDIYYIASTVNWNENTLQEIPEADKPFIYLFPSNMEKMFIEEGHLVWVVGNILVQRINSFISYVPDLAVSLDFIESWVRDKDFHYATGTVEGLEKIVKQIRDILLTRIEENLVTRDIENTSTIEKIVSLVEMLSDDNYSLEDFVTVAAHHKTANNHIQYEYTIEWATNMLGFTPHHVDNQTFKQLVDNYLKSI